MINITHPHLVATLKKPPFEIVGELTPAKADLIHMAMGISGEAGELLDCIKKHVIYGKELDKENLKEELGDLEFFMEGLRQITGFTRDEILQHNIVKLTKRYGERYSNEAAIKRADKQ